MHSDMDTDTPIKRSVKKGTAKGLMVMDPYLNIGLKSDG